VKKGRRKRGTPQHDVTTAIASVLNPVRMRIAFTGLIPNSSSSIFVKTDSYPSVGLILFMSFSAIRIMTISHSNISYLKMSAGISSSPISSGPVATLRYPRSSVGVDIYRYRGMGGIIVKLGLGKL